MYITNAQIVPSTCTCLKAVALSPLPHPWSYFQDQGACSCIEERARNAPVLSHTPPPRPPQCVSPARSSWLKVSGPRACIAITVVHYGGIRSDQQGSSSAKERASAMMHSPLSRKSSTWRN